VRRAVPSARCGAGGQVLGWVLGFRVRTRHTAPGTALRTVSAAPYQYSSRSCRFLGALFALKYSHSGHQASGLKPFDPAIGRTSRCVQHSTPSSGGRRQRHDRKRSTAGESAAAGGVAGVSTGATGVTWSAGPAAGSSLKLDANGLLQRA